MQDEAVKNVGNRPEARRLRKPDSTKVRSHYDLRYTIGHFRVAGTSGRREEKKQTQSQRNSPLSNIEILLFLPLQDLSRLRAWSKFAH